MTLQTRLTSLAQAVGADIKALNAKIPLEITMDTWHLVGAAGEPTFASGWGNWGSALSTCGFRKYPDGRVALRGVLIATTAQLANATIFTLPIGYRPTADLILDQGTSGGGIGITIAASTGAVRVNPALSINSQVWLDGAQFDTESVLQTATVAAQPMEPWHSVGAAGEPAFQNNWVNNAANQYARFRKYPDGKVRLAGLIKTGGTSTIAFTLPLGYRPPVTVDAVRFNIEAAAAGSTGRVAIDNLGNVIPANGSGSVTTYAVLDNIEFDTETVTSYATGMLSAPPLVTSLPGPPLVDGQECYFATSNAITNAIWHLRYVAALGDAYKWQVIGGGPIISPVESAVATVSAGAVVASPTLTLPLAGFYELYVQSEITSSVAAAALYLHPAAGGVNLTGTWGGINQSVASTYPSAYDRFITPAALAAGTVIQIWANGPATATVRGRRIWATPIRVG